VCDLCVTFLILRQKKYLTHYELGICNCELRNGRGTFHININDIHIDLQ
jgi:hypothetical protein